VIKAVFVTTLVNAMLSVRMKLVPSTLCRSTTFPAAVPDTRVTTGCKIIPLEVVDSVRFFTMVSALVSVSVATDGTTWVVCADALTLNSTTKAIRSFFILIILKQI